MTWSGIPRYWSSHQRGSLVVGQQFWKRCELDNRTTAGGSALHNAPELIQKCKRQRCRNDGAIWGLANLIFPILLIGGLFLFKYPQHSRRSGQP